MAIWNEILEGGLNQLLAKRLGMQTGSPTPSISPELGAGLVLENDRPEYSYLKGEMLAGARASVTAVAAQFSFVGLVNPVSSGAIITVERISIVPAASFAFFRVRAVTGIGGTPLTATVRDARWITVLNGTARPAGLVSSGTSGAVAPEAAYESCTASARYTTETPVVLKPGSCVFVELITANIDISDFSILWRERAAAPGELGL